MRRNCNQGRGGRIKSESDGIAGDGRERPSNPRKVLFRIGNGLYKPGLTEGPEMEEQAGLVREKPVNPEKGGHAVSRKGRPAGAGRGVQTGTWRSGNTGSAREVSPPSYKVQSDTTGIKAGPNRGSGERGRRRTGVDNGKPGSGSRGTRTQGSHSVDRESGCRPTAENVKLKTTRRDKLRNSGQEIVGGEKPEIVHKKTRSQAYGIENVKPSESSRLDKTIRPDSANLRDCSGNMVTTSWSGETWGGAHIKSGGTLSESLVGNDGYRADSSLEPVDVSDMIKFSSDEEDPPLDPEQGPPLDRKKSCEESADCAAESTEAAPATIDVIKSRLDRCRANIDAFTAQKRHIDETVDRRYRLSVLQDIDAATRRNLSALLRGDDDDDLLEAVEMGEGYMPGEYVPRKWDARTAHLLPPDPAEAAVFTEFDSLYELAKAEALSKNAK